jgi:hypothetical protein
MTTLAHGAKPSMDRPSVVDGGRHYPVRSAWPSRGRAIAGEVPAAQPRPYRFEVRYSSTCSSVASDWLLPSTKLPNTTAPVRSSTRVYRPDSVAQGLP